MNVLELREEQKIHEVNFHGATLHISIDMPEFYLAADEDGSVYLYEHSPEPSLEDGVFCPSDDAEFYFKVAEVNLNGANWRDTVMRVEV